MKLQNILVALLIILNLFLLTERQTNMRFSELLEKMVKGQPMSEPEKQMLVFEARNIESAAQMFNKLLLTGTSTLRLEGITVSNGDVVMDNEGIVMKNDDEAVFSFLDAEGNRGTISIYSDETNRFGFNNLAENNAGFRFFIKLDEDTTPYIRWDEDGDQAGRTILEVAGGSEGSRLRLADGDNDAAFEVRTEGDTAGSTFMRLRETTRNPTITATSDNVNIYLKGDKLIIHFNDAGDQKWWYLDLTSASDQSWIYSATTP